MLCCALQPIVVFPRQNRLLLPPVPPYHSRLPGSYRYKRTGGYVKAYETISPAPPGRIKSQVAGGHFSREQRGVYVRRWYIHGSDRRGKMGARMLEL